jgi:hypothetical protein
MGEHKYNPTAILAKEGKIEPKPPRPGKREREREINRLIWEKVFNRRANKRIK